MEKISDLAKIRSDCLGEHSHYQRQKTAFLGLPCNGWWSYLNQYTQPMFVVLRWWYKINWEPSYRVTLAQGKIPPDVSLQKGVQEREKESHYIQGSCWLCPWVETLLFLNGAVVSKQTDDQVN
jgi:hypothetical protein